MINGEGISRRTLLEKTIKEFKLVFKEEPRSKTFKGLYKDLLSRYNVEVPIGSSTIFYNSVLVNFCLSHGQTITEPYTEYYLNPKQKGTSKYF